MRTASVSALLALGLAVQQAAATGWTDAHTYHNPYNTNNQCVGEQSKGLGFNDRSNGDLGNYGDLNWQNLKCTDGLQKRTSGPHEEGSHGEAPEGFAGGRCASGTVSKDVDTSPRFSCGSEQKGMSIDHIHVSTSEQTDIELHYGYDNGDVCKQTETCSPAGKIIKNKQCGDAKSVTVKLPDTDKKDKCEVGIHSVGFNCGPASSKPPVPSSTSPPVESTSVVSTPVSSISQETTPQETKPYPYPTANTTTPAGPTTAASTTPESPSISSTFTFTGEVPLPSSTTVESPTTPAYTNTSVASTTPVETIPTTTSIASTTPAEIIPTTTAPGTTVPVVTTEVYEYRHERKHNLLRDYIHDLHNHHYKYLDSVHVLRRSSGFHARNLDRHSRDLDYTRQPSDYPDHEHYCVYTTITTCPVTSTITSGDTTLTVQECVSAWAANNNDVQGALSYLAGICAPHVTQNPGIITNVPKTITLVPTPASPAQTSTSGTLAPPSASSAPITSIAGPPGNSPISESFESAPANPPVGSTIPASSALVTPIAGSLGNVPIGESSVSVPANPPVGSTRLPPAQPVTTLRLSQPVTYPCPVSQLPDGQPQAPASSSCTSLLVTQVVVPQVGFTTAPAAPGVTNPSVGLAAGSPAQVLATTTAGSIGSSPIGATTFGTVVGSASAVGSTIPQGAPIPFTGSASNTKTTGFGILAGLIGMLLLA
ncbi:MAG: hypothetical protein Q9166_002452 [cf. Caloplaca sp. 2 TL-2023]